MPQPNTRLLEQLEELKRPAGARGRKLLRSLLARVGRSRFNEAESLLRLHETLLFMRAYPQSRQLLRQTESLLKTFGARVRELYDAGADISPLLRPETTGVAGTEFSVTLSYEPLRWLARAHPSRTEIDWEGYEDHTHLYAILPRFLPLFEEEVYVDTHTPFEAWLRAAKRKDETGLQWLIRNFEQLPFTDRERTSLFDPLKIWVRWRLGDSRASRTHARLPARKIFFHEKPFLRRADISLERELDSAPMKVERLKRDAAENFLAVARDAMAVRLRDLHGFSYPSARSVVRADAGRGTEIYAWGVPPENRLPLLAYLAAMVFKNGVPIAYAEALTLFERSEVGFNLFYTFRDGEAAWTYARVLRLFRQLHGVEVFSAEPYQLGGSGNEEGIESGAFWFYRKLGFRPITEEPAALLETEERKLKARHGYRTTPATLRKLAAGHAVYDTGRAETRVWDHFRIRNIGLAVQRRMRDKAESDTERIRALSLEEVTRALSLRTSRWNEDERRALSNYALVLALVPDLARWSVNEKSALVQIIRAKAGREELRYARLLRGHARLRRALIEIGSNETG